jgi:hypothetical protein
MPLAVQEKGETPERVARPGVPELEARYAGFMMGALP